MYTGEIEKPHYRRHWCSKRRREKCTIVTGPWQFGNPARCMLASFYTPRVGRVPWLGPNSTLLKYMPNLLFFWALGNTLSALPSWLFFLLSKKWPMLVREKLSHPVSYSLKDRCPEASPISVSFTPSCDVFFNTTLLKLCGYSIKLFRFTPYP